MCYLSLLLTTTIKKLPDAVDDPILEMFLYPSLKSPVILFDLQWGCKAIEEFYGIILELFLKKKRKKKLNAGICLDKKLSI